MEWLSPWDHGLGQLALAGRVFPVCAVDSDLEYQKKKKIGIDNYVLCEKVHPLLAL